jgi:hypothetical protein
MGMAEEWRRKGDCGWDDKFLELSSLAFVTCMGVPADIVIKVGPPELFQQLSPGDEDAFMTESIMGFAD